jgi:hypothetical protein
MKRQIDGTVGESAGREEREEKRGKMSQGELGQDQEEKAAGLQKRPSNAFSVLLNPNEHLSSMANILTPALHPPSLTDRKSVFKSFSAKCSSDLER